MLRLERLAIVFEHRSCYTVSVRRFILSLLLVILPLQFSWAAEAAYCAHETGAAANHFGHHDHRHTSGDASKDKVTKASGLLDADCDMCHFGCGVLVTDVLTVADVDAQPVRFAEPVEHDSHIPQLPERPDQLRLA